MQVVEVRMRDQYQIHRRKIINFDAGLPQALEHEQPPGEIGINDNIFASHLEKKAGMTDKGHAHLAIGHQYWPMRFAGRGRHGRVANQASELPGTLAQRGIFQGLF